jgi:hypothetical protein
MVERGSGYVGTTDGRLRQAVQQLSSLPSGTAPSRELLSSLLEAWGPDPQAPDVNFLEDVGRMSLSTGVSILECGAGPTTVMLAATAGRRGVRVCTLEPSIPVRQRVSRLAEELGLPVHVYDGPPNPLGRFVWYDPPTARLSSQLWPMASGDAPATVAQAR